MPVVADELGRITVEAHPATQGAAGRYFERREPQGTAADVVVILGTTPVGDERTGYEPEFVVASATFGATPDEWDGRASVSYDMDAFAADYVDADLARVAKDAEAARKAADAAVAKIKNRQSAWSRS